MNRISQLLLSFLLLASSAVSGSKLPEISPKDTKEILHQMLEAHVSHKQLSPQIVQRTLELYLEELDPTKTYLTQEEVEPWLKSTPEALSAIQKSIEKGDFSHFVAMREKMIHAIARHNAIEKTLENTQLPTDVKAAEFKDLTYAATAEELATRLTRIKALQATAAAKLDDEARDKALQRIAKRRLSREEDILANDPVESERFVLSLFLKAVASSLDTHTAYFTPGEASQFMIQVQQRLFGIGAQLRDDLNGFSVVKIIEGGPADGTPLKVNDRIIAINKEPVVGMDITSAVELIRGEEGTPVLLTVLRPTLEGQEEKLDIKMTRGEVVIKEARIESSIVPFGDGVIAHIGLHAFYQDPLHSSAGDLYEEIAKIRKDHKIRGIILDLRHNSGGVLPQAVAVTGLFISKGIVVSIKDNNGSLEHLRNIDGRPVWDGPLIVLTSKASASAAEIVAQTLQDYGRALIIGDEHTYGKGSFQTFTLDAGNNGKVNPKGEFKVTRGLYYTVSGKSPQLVGVRPDIVVPGLTATLDMGERHSKYPLDNDLIAENFHDDLADIPAAQREQISWLYRFNLQSKLKTYSKALPVLQENSKKRLETSKIYKAFLEEMDKEEFSDKFLEFFAPADLQLKETIDIMKDLIVLLT